MSCQQRRICLLTHVVEEEQQAAEETEEEKELRMQRLKELTAQEIAEATDQLQQRGVRYMWLVRGLLSTDLWDRKESNGLLRERKPLHPFKKNRSIFKDSHFSELACWLIATHAPRFDPP